MSNLFIRIDSVEGEWSSWNILRLGTTPTPLDYLVAKNPGVTTNQIRWGRMRTVNMHKQLLQEIRFFMTTSCNEVINPWYYIYPT
jgi:hypothetical protein